MAAEQLRQFGNRRSLKSCVSNPLSLSSSNSHLIQMNDIWVRCVGTDNHLNQSGRGGSPAQSLIDVYMPHHLVLKVWEWENTSSSEKHEEISICFCENYLHNNEMSDSLMSGVIDLLHTQLRGNGGVGGLYTGAGPHKLSWENLPFMSNQI